MLGWVILSLTALGARAESGWERCRQHLAAPTGAESAEQRKYAPDREIDILHLALDLTPHFQERSLDGQATLRFKPIAKPFSELKLNAVDLQVSEVTASETIQGWQATADQILVTFAQPIPPDQEASVTIRYGATPAKGLYFRTPELGYKPEDAHVFTQGESIESRYWFPCFDAPNEKFTSEVTCRVPAGMVVLSNGRKVSEETDAGTGLVAVRWLQDKPHATYLMALAAGYFKKVEDRYRDIPLAFYTPASQVAQAQNSFAGTKDMLAFFERETGVPYPWAKYYQVCVNDFVAGGMENTSLTILTDRTLHPAEFEDLRDSAGLVSHELAHQWFGDLVTCKDWANIWLNEGFATYYEQLYEGHRRGRDELLYSLCQSAKHVLSQPNQTNAIVRRDYQNPDELFNYLAYPKGGWVLHMLRSQLGDELYRRCIKAYLEAHAYGTVITEDLNQVLERLSGRSFDGFFDQWVYHAGYPDLAVSYTWDEKSRLARVSVQQNQKLGDSVLLFRFPLTVRFIARGHTADRQVYVKQKSEDFYVALPAAPERVRIDPELTLLAKINYTPPTPALYAQLADSRDVVGRLLAVEQLGGRKDAPTVAKLKQALNQDAHYGVRLAASQALRGMQTDEALAALLASTQQSDARVRRQVVADLGGFYNARSCQAALQVLAQEKNPDIAAAAITLLGAYAKPEVKDKLLACLRSQSYENVLADAAINALRSQDDPGCLEPLLQTLREREREFTTGGLSRGFKTLAYLARRQEPKDAVRDYLLGFLGSKNRQLRLGAISALGTLGDPKAIAPLETFTTGKDTPEKGAAERAVASLHEERKPSAELGSLRTEVLSLQKDNRDLRQSLEDLKKKVEALAPLIPPTQAAPELKKKPKAEARSPKAGQNGQLTR